MIKWYLEYKRNGRLLWCFVDAENEDCVKRICANHGVVFIRAYALK